jgi:hypothetical protein
MNRASGIALVLSATLLLSACASQIDAGVASGAEVPGFWWGLWHGFIFPFAWAGSLFLPDGAVYAVPNTGAGTISASSSASPCSAADRGSDRRGGAGVLPDRPL